MQHLTSALWSRVRLRALPILRAVLPAVLAAAVLGLAAAPERRMTRVALTLAAADVARLGDLGYEVVAVDPDGAWADILQGATPDGAAPLRAHGLPILDERPLDGSYRPDGQYKTPAQVESLLKDYAVRYPMLTTLRSIGRSTEGRDIWALKITANAYAGIVTKPVVLFNAMHHAREVMSTEIALDTIEQLLTRYGSDERVTHWVQDDEIWVIPMINVDGSNKVWTADSMWRKNTKDGHGVDINRNYPFRWGACQGSSGQPNAEDFRGEAPASEVETQAIMRLVSEIRPVANISYHSYGEILIYPYGCDGARTPKSDVVADVGREMARRIPTDDGRGSYRPGTSWELLYAVDGSDIDWMYEQFHVLPFVIEVNSGFANGGFQPPFSQRGPTVEHLRQAWGYLLDRLDGPGLRGRVSRADGSPRSDATLTIESLSDLSLQPATYRVNPDGGFHVVLRAGHYRVTTKAGDGQSVVRELTLNAGRRDLSLTL